MKDGWFCNEFDYNDNFNLVCGKYFGFVVFTYRGGDCVWRCLYIGSLIFGWRDYYNTDGSIDLNDSGVYLNDVKI